MGPKLAGRRKSLRLPAARLRQGDIAGAHEMLRPLIRSAPDDAPALHQWATTLAAMGEEAAALPVLQRSVTLDPEMAESWQALADLALLMGHGPEAGHAYAQAMRIVLRGTSVTIPADYLAAGQAAQAEQLLKAHVRRLPDDVAAHWLLGEAAMRVGRIMEAASVLQACLSLSPQCAAAHRALAVLHYQQADWGEAARHLTVLVSANPSDATLRKLLAAASVRSGDHAGAIAQYVWLLRRYRRQPRITLLYGHALKTVGRELAAVSAYRHCIAIAPGFTAAYLSLADVKTAQFTPDELAAMRARLVDPTTGGDAKCRLHYAMGHALERAADYAEAFAHYQAGAALRRGLVRYDAAQMHEAVERARQVFTADAFASQTGAGCQSDAPIFIVGLPRSGSTLVEQILASHEAVEGTAELPELGRIAEDLSRMPGPGYPALLFQLDAVTLQRLGERYLTGTRMFRKSARPFFTDKMPDNFFHIGLIHLILPKAKIIDVRRAPMAAGFAAFKQYFPERQEFSSDLGDIGRYYRDYVALTAHFDAVLPDRVHTVAYESLVTDTEHEVRRLLDYCGLPFDQACLRFWENTRPVETPSAQQVRRPIFRNGLEQWRNFEPWLGPLKDSLQSP